MRWIHTRVHDYFLTNTNAIIRSLIIGDVLYYASAGLLGPIFSLFVTGFIQDGGAEVAGIAIAVYLLTKSIAQIPIGAFVDKIKGDKDDFWFMFGGAAVASLVPLSYLFISTPFQLYCVEFVLGIALAFNFPSFMALFTKYLDDEKEATAWSIYFTLSDLASAGTAALGGFLAVTFGFQSVIIGVSILGMTGALALFPIRKHLRTYTIRITS